jgi:hypothetical protein
VLDESALIEKLAQLRRSTKLQVQNRKQYKIHNGKVVPTGIGDVKDTWVVAYGRIDATKQWVTFLRALFGKKFLEFGGYGHIGAAPVQIVVKDMNVRLIRDEEYPTSPVKK